MPLWDRRAWHNTTLFNELKEDEHSDCLYSHTIDETTAGETSIPVPSDTSTDIAAVYQPRFVSTYQRAEGTLNPRAIDNASWAPHHGNKLESLNGSTVIADAIVHQIFDDLSAELQLLYKEVDKLPSVSKCDIDNARRRFPVDPEHCHFYGLACKRRGEVSFQSHFVRRCAYLLTRPIYQGMHYSCPLGAIGSVLVWDLVGSVSAHIAKVDVFSLFTANDQIRFACRC